MSKMHLVYLNTLGAEGFFIISVASANISAIFTYFQLKNKNRKNMKFTVLFLLVFLVYA
jgi:hypothetical protein